jgi:hypothetical protein
MERISDTPDARHASLQVFRDASQIHPTRNEAGGSSPCRAGLTSEKGVDAWSAFDQSAASLSFCSARVLILTVAGLAAKARSCFVNGSMPVRLFLVNTLMTLTFRRPGSVNEPRSFL